MKSYSAAFHTKRHSGKLITVHAGFTNPDPNLETDSEDLAIIGRR